eukprot:206468_1
MLQVLKKTKDACVIKNNHKNIQAQMDNKENINTEIIDSETISLTLDNNNKKQLISIHIADADISEKHQHYDILPQTPSNIRKLNGKRRRYSWPLIYIKSNSDITIRTPQKKTKRFSLPSIEHKLDNTILTPQRIEFACFQNEKALFAKTHSILKPPRSPRSLKPKKVRFAQDITEERRLSMWYHANSPKRKKPGWSPRKPSNSSHTREGTAFSTNLDDPKDFGPYHNPNPGFLGDYDYQHDDDLE